jgi:hypothetical protein
MTQRRLFALIAAFAVAWGALWPLVSVAKPRSASLPNFVCTQSGFQHAPAPDGGDGNFHCPLCVVTCDVALPAMAPAQDWIAPQQAGAIVCAVPRFTPRLAARPPPSHAPPPHS